jgi:hypothetical protein
MGFRRAIVPAGSCVPAPGRGSAGGTEDRVPGNSGREPGQGASPESLGNGREPGQGVGPEPSWGHDFAGGVRRGHLASVGAPIPESEEPPASAGRRAGLDAAATLQVTEVADIRAAISVALGLA